ncbi:MAG: hypothetical protein KAT65_07055, partial [Methanophagales archaeon]|nr:hypothetical protein [Methanophagales archaeon]
VKFDFVHPSYHEAFWYAIKRNLPLHRWWELLKDNIGKILEDFENPVDLVQLRMIERYGTINRDLDQLLLLSAKSDDVNEQLIALEHMLERLEQFVNLPQFSHCARCTIESADSEHRYKFLNLVDKCFDQLPLDVLNAVPPLLFDPMPEIRLKSEQIIFKYFDKLPDSVKQCGTMQTWRIANDIISIPEESPLKRDFDLFSTLGSLIGEEYPLRRLRYHSDYRTSVTTDLSGIVGRSIDRFVKISPADLQQLFKTDFCSLLRVILKIVRKCWDKLSSEQKEVIPIGDLLASEDYAIQETAMSLVLEHYEELAHLAEKNPIIEDLKNLQESFDITFKPGESFISKLNSISIDDWLQIPPNVLKMLITLPRLTEAPIPKVLENYDKLSQEQKEVIIASKSSPKVAREVDRYIEDNKYDFRNLSDSALIDLLFFPGLTQYMVLPGLLIRFDRLSKEAKIVINGLIDNPPDWWVGGSIGLLTSKCRFEVENKLSAGLKDLPIKLSRHQNKRIVGAMLADMVQFKYDRDHGLQDMYEPLLREILSDPEAVRYVEAWFDYKFETYGRYNETYWSEAKAYFRKLVEKG